MVQSMTSLAEAKQSDKPEPGQLAGTRILVVMPSIPLHGMERKTLQIMQEMKDEGADVLFITQETYGDNIRREVERIGCRWTTATFDKLLHLTKNPREMASVLRAWMKSALEFKRICKGYGPTHIHITNMTFFMYTWPVLWLMPQRVIFCLPVPPDTNLTPAKQRLSNFIWRYGVDRVCDVIVCNSLYTFSQLIRIGMPTDKAQVIYSTVPDRETPLQSDAPRIDRDKLNVVYMGRISAEKGVGELIEAALRIASERDDVNFYLAGDYSWKNPFAETLIREVQSKNLESRVHFLGEIQDIRGLLSQCDLHVCPSVCEEAFGLVVLEAKSQSLPSVVFPSGGLTEVVEHLVDGYICEEKSSYALYKGISHFLDNSSARQAAGETAKRSLARFSKNVNTIEWVNIYKQRGKYSNI